MFYICIEILYMMCTFIWIVDARDIIYFMIVCLSLVCMRRFFPCWTTHIIFIWFCLKGTLVIFASMFYLPQNIGSSPCNAIYSAPPRINLNMHKYIVLYDVHIF